MTNWQNEKEKIQVLLYEKELTLQAVADLYGVSRQYIHQLISDWNFPSLFGYRKQKRLERYIPKPPRPTLMEKFHQHIGDKSDCWQWIGPICKHTGFGRVNWSHYTKEQHAHRIAWMLYHGEIPRDKHERSRYVFRSCRNKLCVNPQHLKLSK